LYNISLSVSIAASGPQQAKDSLQQQLHNPLGGGGLVIRPQGQTSLPSMAQTFVQPQGNQPLAAPTGQPLQPLPTQPAANTQAPANNTQQPVAKKQLSLTVRTNVEY